MTHPHRRRHRTSPRPGMRHLGCRVDPVRRGGRDGRDEQCRRAGHRLPLVRQARGRGGWPCAGPPNSGPIQPHDHRGDVPCRGERADVRRGESAGRGIATTRPEGGSGSLSYRNGKVGAAVHGTRSPESPASFAVACQHWETAMSGSQPEAGANGSVVLCCGAPDRLPAELPGDDGSVVETIERVALWAIAAAGPAGPTDRRR